MTAWYEGPLTALALRARPPAAGAPRGADPERDRLCAAAVAAQPAPDAPVEMHSSPTTWPGPWRRIRSADRTSSCALRTI